MTIRLEPKRSDEKRRLRHDWTPYLGEDTIATQTTTSTDVTISDVEIEVGDKSIVFTVDGGTDGETATIIQSIVTDTGDEETEIFTLKIGDDEPVSLAEAKDAIRVRHSDHDSLITSMIPRARLWVEDHTGLALVRRTFIERHTPQWGAIRLNKGPLVAETPEDVEITYLSSATPTTYVPRSWPPGSTLFPAADEAWPALSSGEQFTVSYVAGYGVGEVHGNLIGAMLALIEGEYAEAYAYPQRATEAAERCCAYLRTMVA